MKFAKTLNGFYKLIINGLVLYKNLRFINHKIEGNFILEQWAEKGFKKSDITFYFKNPPSQASPISSQEILQGLVVLDSLVAWVEHFGLKFDRRLEKHYVKEHFNPKENQSKFVIGLVTITIIFAAVGGLNGVIFFQIPSMMLAEAFFLLRIALRIKWFDAVFVTRMGLLEGIPIGLGLLLSMALRFLILAAPHLNLSFDFLSPAFIVFAFIVPLIIGIIIIAWAANKLLSTIRIRRSEI